jgi:hypothetical protein
MAVGGQVVIQQAACALRPFYALARFNSRGIINDAAALHLFLLICF